MSNKEKFEVEMKLMNEISSAKKLSWKALKSIIKLCAIAESD
jgi:hypothetical protein